MLPRWLFEAYPNVLVNVALKGETKYEYSCADRRLRRCMLPKEAELRMSRIASIPYRIVKDQWRKLIGCRSSAVLSVRQRPSIAYIKKDYQNTCGKEVI